MTSHLCFGKLRQERETKPGGQERCEKVAVTLQGTLGYRCENFVGGDGAAKSPSPGPLGGGEWGYRAFRGTVNLCTNN